MPHSKKKNKKKNQQLLKVISYVITAIASAFSYEYAQGTQVTCPVQEPKSSNVIIVERITRVDYERLKPGMSLAEVESILGAGIEISSSNERAIFLWKNPNSSKITATFEKGKLQSKEQSGLK